MPNLPFDVLGVDHAGLAPKDAAQAHAFFNDILNLPHIGQEFVADQKTDTDIFLASVHSDSTASRLEILSDHSDAGDGPIAKFLDRKGSGIHHLALRVSDVSAALKYLSSKNVRLVDETPRLGAHGTLIGFVHPEATGGILLELVQSIPKSG